MPKKIKVVAVANSLTDIPIIHKGLKNTVKKPRKEEILDVTIVDNTKGRKEIMKKVLITTDWTNTPDGLEGDVQIEEKDIVTSYHLGTCDNEKNRQRKMNSDAKKILRRRLRIHQESSSRYH